MIFIIMVGPINICMLPAFLHMNLGKSKPTFSASICMNLGGGMYHLHLNTNCAKEMKVVAMC